MSYANCSDIKYFVLKTVPTPEDVASTFKRGKIRQVLYQHLFSIVGTSLNSLEGPGVCYVQTISHCSVIQTLLSIGKRTMLHKHGYILSHTFHQH